MKCPRQSNAGDHVHTCSRLVQPALDHYMSHAGPCYCVGCSHQWDSKGVRVAPGNNPYKEKEK